MLRVGLLAAVQPVGHVVAEPQLSDRVGLDPRGVKYAEARGVSSRVEHHRGHPAVGHVLLCGDLGTAAAVHVAVYPPLGDEHHLFAEAAGRCDPLELLPRVPVPPG